MATMTESCSVCGRSFDVQFRYQMEERDSGFSFFCSQKCLEKNQTAGGDGLVTCSACRKNFSVQFVSQVLYVRGRRYYACSNECRIQLRNEARGVRLGDMIAEAAAISEAAGPVEVSEAGRTAKASKAPETPDTVETAETAEAAETAATVETVETVETVDNTACSAEIDSPPASVPYSSNSIALAHDLISFDEPAEHPADEQSQQEQARREPAHPAEPVSLIPSVDKRTTQVLGNHTTAPLTSTSVLAVFNHKGGTGKTTTSVSIAAGLALAGFRVLLVDTDAQGNVGVSLDKKAERSLYHVLVMGLPLKAVIQTVRENLDFVASNETLAAAELYLAGRQNRDRILRDKLVPYVHAYDFVILDCSPSLSLMNQNALVFADSVLVPVACDYLSLVGVRQVVKTVRNVNQLLHHPVRLWGVLPTFYDARANICREAVDTLQKHFGDRCLPPIRSAIKVKEAPAHGQTIFEYAGTSTAAEDYRAIVDRIVREREEQLCTSESTVETLSATAAIATSPAIMSAMMPATATIPSTAAAMA